MLGTLATLATLVTLARERRRRMMGDARPFDVDEDPFCCVVATELLLEFDAAKFALVHAEERACGHS
jgi:hypothetical protein